MAYWRVVENFVEFQNPKQKGEYWHAADMIKPGFVIDINKLKFSFYSKREDDRAIGDFCDWRSGYFFVSARAYRALAELFDQHGRVFPVKCGEHQYYIITVDNEVDALDYERSTFDRLGKYDDLEKDLLRIRKIALKPVVRPEFDIFRLKGKPDVAFEILVSDKFKCIYDNANLTGLLFRSVIQ